MELLLVCLQVVHFSFPPLVVSIIATSQANTGQSNCVFSNFTQRYELGQHKMEKKTPFSFEKKGMMPGKHQDVLFCQP